MEVKVVKTKEEGSALAAQIFIQQLKAKPASVLGLATGSTPVLMYQELAAACKRGEISFAKVRTFNLDEYIGLPPTHDQSYDYFMHEQLFNHVDLPKGACLLPPGRADDFVKAAADYEKAIVDAGGIDIQLLGLGGNGHIGFNEPGCDLNGRTHTQDLTQQTIADNARLFFNGDLSQVPTSAITMGIGTIMDARKCVLIAFGTGKADAVFAMVKGEVSPACPASALQRHKDCVVIVDEAAAAKL